jgi:TctA family transporter
MPGWKLHTFSGMIVTAILILIVYSVINSKAINVDSIDYFALVVAGFACVLGALMPDYDYRKTMIRHTFGPVFGGFISFGYLYTRGWEANLGTAIIIFIVIVVCCAVLSIIPLKHHGRFHSITSALLYGIGWALISYFMFELDDVAWVGIIAGFAVCGYILHLLLDLDLKL